MAKNVYNFYAGPATLPLEALKQAQKELLNFKGTGMSLMTISHRSKQYAEVHLEASNLVRKLMNLTEEYKEKINKLLEWKLIIKDNDELRLTKDGLLIFVLIEKFFIA